MASEKNWHKVLLPLGLMVGGGCAFYAGDWIGMGLAFIDHPPGALIFLFQCLYFGGPFLALFGLVLLAVRIVSLLR